MSIHDVKLFCKNLKYEMTLQDALIEKVESNIAKIQTKVKKQDKLIEKIGRRLYEVRATLPYEVWSKWEVEDKAEEDEKAEKKLKNKLRNHK